MTKRTLAERIRRAELLPTPQLIIEAVMHASPETGVPLLDPSSLKLIPARETDKVTWKRPRTEHTPIGLVPAAQFPRFVHIDRLRIVERERDAAEAEAARLSRRVRELFDEAATLRRQLAEAGNRPLVAVVSESGECTECVKLKRRLDAVRALLKQGAAVGG